MMLLDGKTRNEFHHFFHMLLQNCKFLNTTVPVFSNNTEILFHNS